jgi:hypothetical protein
LQLELGLNGIFLGLNGIDFLGFWKMNQMEILQKSQKINPI